jgi:hypothetical protein
MVFRAGLLATCAVLCLPCVVRGAPAGAASGWQSTVVASDCKDEPLYYNSARLAVDSRGQPQAIYVTTAADSSAGKPTQATDTLYHARRVGARWRREAIYAMDHSVQAASGLNGYALALDRRDRPHAYIYSSDYRTDGNIFEERWMFRTGRRWQTQVIRHSQNQLAGAAFHDPHLAVDGLGYLHVTAYAHAGFDTYHRVRHRYFDGSSFRIDAFPRPAGKSDSNASNLFIDSQNVVHLVYDSRKALRDGRAEPGYPDSSLVYVRHDRNGWSAPEIIRPRVGPDPNDTQYFVISAGITVDQARQVHVTYVITKRRAAEPTYVLYAWRDGRNWREQQVAEIPAAESGLFRVSVSNPAIDPAGDPHFAFDTAAGTSHVVRRGGQWQRTQLAGDMHGFAMDRRGGIHLLCRVGSELTHHDRMP